MTARVYIITDDSGSLKVGVSSNPSRRAFSLNAGNPRCLRVEYMSPQLDRTMALAIEAAAHEDLAHWAVGREWFRCPVEYALDALRANGGADPR